MSASLFSAPRALSIAIDGLWATFFAANWRFAAAGVDYFASDTPVSPLQHFWSLGVEEQFYLVWPLLLVGLLIVSSRRSNDPADRRVVGLALGVLVVVSFIWSVWDSNTNPGVAYFSTFTRAWELGAGALLALAFPLVRQLTQVARLIMAIAGLGLLGAAAVVIDEAMPFPGAWALLPVVGTLLVLAGDSPRGLWVLTNRPMNYLGDISYSLYLWHFPSIILLGAAFSLAPWALIGAASAMTLALSVASYHLIEQPVMRSPWLLPASVREPRWTPWWRSYRRSFALGGATTAVAVVVILVAAGTILPKPTGPVGDSRVALGETVAGAEGSAAITEKITTALHTTEWPTLVPAIDDLDEGKNDEFAEGTSCLNPASLTDKTLCTYGDGEQLVVVVGDSFAIAWMPAIRDALEPLGYSVRGIGVSTCPFSTTDVDLDLGATATDRCNSSQQARVDLVNSLDPDVVLILDSEYSYSQTVLGGQESRAEGWVRGRTDVLSQIEAPGRQVAILAPNPGGLKLTECATTTSVPAECTSKVDPAWFSKNQADADAASVSHVTYISTLEWFCEENICPAFIGATPVRWDSGHLTEQYAKTLAEPLRDVLRKLAVVTD